MKTIARRLHLPRLLLAFTFLYVSEVSAVEIDSKEIARCSAIDGALEKLDCYESIARKYEVDKPKEQEIEQPTEGDWRVSLETNPIDDSKTAVALLTASTGERALRDAPVLVVRCRSGDLNIYINWDDYLGSEAYVTFRMGKAPAQKAFWDLSTDSQSTFAKKPLEYFQRMKKVDQVVAQVTPYNENPVTAVFDIKGFNEVSETIGDTCGIKNFQSNASKLSESLLPLAKNETQTDPVVDLDLNDLPDGFSEGTYRLPKIGWVTGWRGASKAGDRYWDIKKYYLEGQWKSLVLELEGVSGNNAHYYLLGLGAEMLGFNEAAVAYYKLSEEMSRKLKTRCMGLCYGLKLPKEANIRVGSLS